MIADSLKSLLKLALHPRRAAIKAEPRPRPLIILGNGPSLNDTMADHAAALRANPLMAVNFFANSPVFSELKPEFYVLADPHFFDSAADPNVSRLLAALEAVDWPMTLFVPFGARCSIKNGMVAVKRYPMTAIEGARTLERAAYSLRLGMPRPRNVLIPAIMVGAWLGFGEIYIVGADHTWPRTVSVNERNEVVSVQPHFYKEDERELDRIRVTYLGVRLHELLDSWRIAFGSYHRIRRWADGRGLKIFNATTPESFIDAFERRPLPHERD